MKSGIVHHAIAFLVSGMAIVASAPDLRAAGPGPGPNNAITDVPGIRVGHYTASHLTGRPSSWPRTGRPACRAA